MKPFIIILLAGLYFCSCNKVGVAPQSLTDSTVIKTWISGKWNRQQYNDTLYNSNNKITSIVTLYDYDKPNVLDFNNQSSGLDSEIKPQLFTYDLQKMTITISGNVWKIVKISDTRFNLVRHDNPTLQGQLDQYIKQ